MCESWYGCVRMGVRESIYIYVCVSECVLSMRMYICEWVCESGCVRGECMDVRKCVCVGENGWEWGKVMLLHRSIHLILAC